MNPLRATANHVDQSDDGGRSVQLRPHRMVKALALWIACFAVFGGTRIAALQIETVWNYTKLAAGNLNQLGGVAIDPEGNIWALSRFGDTSRGQLILSKLDTHGNELWTTNFSDGSFLWQPTLSLAPAGGCVIGASSTNGTVLLRFDPGGQRLWQTVSLNLDGNSTYLTAIAWDIEGSLWITGTFGTCKFNPSGERLWSMPSRGAKALQAPPSQGMVALVDQGVLVLSGDGEVVWRADDFVSRHIYRKAFTYTARLFVDQDGAILIGGIIEDAIAVAKYKGDGTKIWQTEYQGKPELHETMPDDDLSGMRVRASGEIYLAGRSKGTSYQSTDFFTMKLDRDGTTLWRARERFGGSGGALTGLVLDSSDHVYALGGSFSSLTNERVFLTKYDENGSRLETMAAIPAPWVGSLLLAGNGDLLVYGQIYNGATSGFRLTMFRELPASEPLKITEPIADQMIAENGSATLSAPATGPEPLNYQWMFNDTPIAGATGAQLIISGIRADQAGDYSVEVRSGVSVITSSDATVTVSTVPTIHASPSSQSALLGGQAQFSVGAQSTTPLSFQWLKEGQVMPGSLSNRLLLTNLQATQAGLYNATVSSFAGSTNSPAARLRVFASARQAWRSTFDNMGYPSGSFGNLGSPSGVTLDSTGSLAIGSMDNGLGSTVLKIDPAGQELWRVSGLHVFGLAHDGNGNICFAGTDTRSNQVQFGKISPAGQVAWLTNFVAPAPYFRITAFALDSSNNLVAVGLAGGALHSFKFDSSGIRVWTASQFAPQGGSWGIASIATGHQGQVYVVAMATEQSGASAWLFALNPDGLITWSARLGDVDNSWNQPVKAVVDGEGNVFVFSRGPERNSSSLVSYDPDGRRRWNLASSFDAGTIFVPADVVLSGDSALTIGGYLFRWSSSGTQRNEWIVKRIDPEGRMVWSASYLGESDQRFDWLTVDSRGRVYVSGGYGTFHYAENGMLLWHVDALGAGVWAGDDAGNFYTANLVSSGSSTLAVARYQSTAEGEAYQFVAPFPASQLVATGEPLHLEARIESGVPLRFQWTLNGEPLTGQTNASIDILHVGLEHAGRLGLEVYGPSGLLAFPYVDVTVSTKPVIVGQPQSTSQVLGGDVQFAVSAHGTSPLRYQWLFEGSELFGKTNSVLILTNVSSTFAGAYAVRVATLGSETLSKPAQLTVASTMTQSWVVAFSNTSGAYRIGQHVTVDRNGDVYVLGSSGPSYPNDFTVVRYSGAGALLWWHTEPVESYATEGVAGYAWDRSGELILVGSRGYSEAALMRVTPSGMTSLATTRFGSFDSYNVGKALAVDAGNNVYLTGECSDSAARYYGTVKRFAWSQLFTTNSVLPPAGRAIALDNSGRAFVAGTAGTLRYETDGRLTWTALGFDDRAVAIDESQNLFVVGGSVETNSPPGWLLRKYSPNGALTWAKAHAFPATDAEPPGLLLLDAAGSSFVAGKPGLFKFDSDGRELWSLTNFNVAAAARYRSGIVAAGSFVGETPLRYVTQAFDADGNRQWMAQLYNFAAAPYEQNVARGIAATADGRVYVTGRFGGNIVTVGYAPLPIDKVQLSSPVMRSDGDFQFVLRAPVGRSYRIEASDNLTDWKDWLTGRTVEPDTFIKTRLLPAEHSPQFFRANIGP